MGFLHQSEGKKNGRAGFFLLLGICLALFLTGAGIALRHQPSPPPQTMDPAAQAPDPATQRPANGQILLSTAENAASRFTVETLEGMDYLIKLEGPCTILFYVRGGMTAEVQAPAGTYCLKYAYGKTWRNLEERFGPDTLYKKAEELFTFTGQGGWSAKLYYQEADNIETNYISGDEF